MAKNIEVLRNVQGEKQQFLIFGESFADVFLVMQSYESALLV